MPLSAKQAIEQARILHGYHVAEREKLTVIRQYWKGRQKLPVVIPAGSPNEVRVMARSSRVNIMGIVVNSLVQSTFVDGFRVGREDQDAAVWKVWQANRMDARQTAIHRAAFGYGTSYAVVLPGDPVPVIRGVSPRNMTCVYGEDPDWPLWGLERLGRGLWRLYDDTATYYLEFDGNAGKDWTFVEERIHDIGFTPVVRYREEEDLDADDEVEPGDGLNSRDIPMCGQVAPLMPLQDQIDLTTFGLQVAQHYGAFKQRWIIGWLADSEMEAIKTSASRMLTFEDHPDDVKVGEFDQTSLDGYIKSREASLRHAASLSQTPVHELIGELVNLSAEALAAAEAGKDRKVDERKTLLGESHEQTLWLVGRLTGEKVPADAEVKWRDTSARAFAATVDALGKLAQMLGIPQDELWERVPGATDQEIARWKAKRAEGDSFDQLGKILDQQAEAA